MSFKSVSVLLSVTGLAFAFSTVAFAEVPSEESTQVSDNQASEEVAADEGVSSASASNDSSADEGQAAASNESSSEGQTAAAAEAAPSEFQASELAAGKHHRSKKAAKHEDNDDEAAAPAARKGAGLDVYAAGGWSQYSSNGNTLNGWHVGAGAMKVLPGSHRLVKPVVGGALTFHNTTATSGSAFPGFTGLSITDRDVIATVSGGVAIMPVNKLNVLVLGNVGAGLFDQILVTGDNNFNYSSYGSNHYVLGATGVVSYNVATRWAVGLGFTYNRHWRKNTVAGNLGSVGATSNNTDGFNEISAGLGVAYSL